MTNANSRFGLGCNRMSNSTSNRAECIRTIHEAVDAGITHLNTADFYSSGHNEMLIGEAMEGYNRDRYFLSVKFGAMVAPNEKDILPAAREFGIDVVAFGVLAHGLLSGAWSKDKAGAGNRRTTNRGSST